MPRAYRSRRPWADEDLEHVVVRERRPDATLAPDHLGRRPERVQHGLLGRVDHRLEDVVEVVVGNRRQPAPRRAAVARAARRRRRSRRCRDGRPSRSGRGRGRPAARRARAGATRAARRRRRRRCSSPPSCGASPGGSPRRSPTGTPSMTRPGGGIEVREDEDADGAADRRRDPARRADAGLVALRHHPRPAADRALRDGAARRRGDGASGVLRLDLDDASLGEPAVVALADDGDDEVLRPDAWVGRRPRPRPRRRRPARRRAST